MSYASVNDPNGLLVEADHFINGQNFTTAFKDESFIKYGFTECISASECQKEINMEARVVIISDTEININQYSSDGTLKSVNKITRADWDNVNRSYLHARIKNFESYGFQVTMDSFAVVECPAKITDSWPQVQCAKVNFSGINRINQKSEYSFVISNFPLALGQIISYEQKDLWPIFRILKYQLKPIIK